MANIIANTQSMDIIHDEKASQQLLSERKRMLEEIFILGESLTVLVDVLLVNDPELKSLFDERLSSASNGIPINGGIKKNPRSKKPRNKKPYNKNICDRDFPKDRTIPSFPLNVAGK
jgi:hypothetical protein